MPRLIDYISRYPYTDLSALNMDYWIKLVGEVAKDITDLNNDNAAIRQEMADFEQEVREYLDNQDIPQQVKDEVDTYLDTYISSLTTEYFLSLDNWSNRKVLWVGDSYGNGWDGNTSIADPYTRASNILQCSFVNTSHGGDRFGDASTSEQYTFLHQIQNYVSGHDDMSTFTDVIIIGGANDIYFNPSADLSTSIADVCDYVKANFPNARITIAMVARLFGTGANNCTQGNVERILKQYVNGARANHVNYLYEAEYINHDYRLLAADGIHLTSYVEMGNKLACLLRDGKFLRERTGSSDINLTYYVGVDTNGIAPTNINTSGMYYKGHTILADISDIEFDYTDNPISGVNWRKLFKFARVSGTTNTRNIFAAGVQSIRYPVTFAVTYVGTDSNEHNGNFPGSIYFYDGYLWFSIEGFVPNGTDGISFPQVKYIRLATGIQIRIDEADC